MKKEDLYNIAWCIRNEVEKCQEHGYFEFFPNAFCALSSIWIYDMLKLHKAQGEEIEIRQKRRFYNDFPHTWVHYNGFDIDITGDQFNDANLPKVYVGKHNKMYHQFDNITSKHVLFPTEFVTKLTYYKRLDDSVETLYKNLNIDVKLFYKIEPEH